jgi:hypothetical protein
MNSVKIGDIDVRIDKESGFLCITDLASIRGTAYDNIKGWMKNTQTLRFFEAWERDNTADRKGVDFEDAFRQNRDQAFYISASKLVAMGCQGIFVKKGRWGGTFCHIDWATHFANWFDPEYYVYTIRALRELTTKLYGLDQNYLAFSRQLAAKNYKMITQANSKRHIPKLPDPGTRDIVYGDQKGPVRRHLKQVDADILNLAIWQMTAKQWRAKFQPKDKRANMRDFATAEELNTMASLQVILRHLQEDQYSREEMLDRLTIKAREFVKFYCDTPEKIDRLKKARKTRGW